MSLNLMRIDTLLDCMKIKHIHLIVKNQLYIIYFVSLIFHIKKLSSTL